MRPRNASSSIVVPSYPEERTAITNYIKENELKPVHLLVTHGHLDHNFGNNTIYQEFGLKPEVAAG